MFRQAVLVVCALLLPALSQAQVKLLRHPTYSKGKVAFSYLGDIWIANENGTGILRLTDNEARDQYPRFSPDGNWIAFSSNRDGNDDVYVIPSTGGKPRQLTFHSAPDTVFGWTPDGKKILFASTRGKGAFPTVATLFEVPVEGGIEQPLPVDWGAWGSYSPDGKKLVFQRHPSVWSRKHYRGAYAADLWVMDVAAKTYSNTRLGDPAYHGNSLWPMYGADGYIYFVADITANEKTIKNNSPEVMKSVNNIWKVSEKGGMPIQVTHHGDGNLFFPSISADRKTIVYEDNFGLWKLDTASGKYTEIRIDIKSDSKTNDTELVTVSNNQVEGFHLSPSNQRAAIVVHGEIFTIATDRGEPQRVTETAWREQNPRWSPNGKWIAFISDRTGRQEVWISDELGKTPKKLSDADCDKSAIVWAPDSKSLLWNGTDHKLRRVDVDSGEDRRPGGESRRQHRHAAVFAGWQVDLLLQAGQPAAHPRVHQEPGLGRRAHDRLRPVPGVLRRQVDARWQETAGDRRREPARHGVHGLPRHAQPALQRLAHPRRQSARRSRGRHRGAGRGGARRGRGAHRARWRWRWTRRAWTRAVGRPRTSPWRSNGTAWIAASRSSPA